MQHILCLKTITDILDKKAILYKQISDNMVILYITKNYKIGSMAISLGKIRCRFHYFDGVKHCVSNFIYNEEQFNYDLNNARNGLIRLQNKAVEDAINEI